MTIVASRYEIQPADLTRLDEPRLLSLARLHQAIQHERLPHLPPDPLELITRRERNRPDEMESRDWIVTIGEDVVGLGQLIRWKSEGNAHWREIALRVHPEHRRQGIARALAREFVAANDDPQAVFAFGTNDRAPGGEIARAIGATEALPNRKSELDLATVDRALVRRWASIDPAGYRLEWIDGDVPEALIANVLVAYDTMNTAPRGNSSMGDWRATAEQIRDWERVRRANGGQHLLLLAIEDATGATAAFTEVGRHPMTPWIVGQQGTATVPAHRGHGIGKWIKAAMIERVWRDWPDARVIHTGNAYSNAPMLSINDRLGFKVILSQTLWETDLAGLRRFAENSAP